MSDQQGISLPTNSNRLESVSKRESASYLPAVALAVLFFILSVVVAPYHTAGDQVSYTRAYDRIRGVSIVDGIGVYRRIINSYEIVHYLFAWVGSNLNIEKTIFFAIVNAALVFFAAKLLLDKGFGAFSTIIIVCTGYYLYTLCFTLEKLKIAILMCLLAMNSKSRGAKLTFGFLSVLSHFQMIIVFSAALFGYLGERISFSAIVRFLRKKFLLTCCVLGFVVVVALWFRGFISSKLSYYAGIAGGGALGKLALLAVLMVSSFVTVKREFRRRFNFSILALSVAIYFVGGDRLTMIVYFFFITYLNVRSKLAVGVVLVMSIYLAYKTFVYLSMIVNFGG
jgi:hypothetical protein